MNFAGSSKTLCSIGTKKKTAGRNASPFTMPLDEDLPKLDRADDPTRSALRAQAYDLVLNGLRAAARSSHDGGVKTKSSTLGMTRELAKEQFGFPRRAPIRRAPHGGLARVDRVVMLFTGRQYRDCIAFRRRRKRATHDRGAFRSRPETTGRARD